MKRIVLIAGSVLAVHGAFAADAVVTYGPHVSAFVRAMQKYEHVRRRAPGLIHNRLYAAIASCTHVRAPYPPGTFVCKKLLLPAYPFAHPDPQKY